MCACCVDRRLLAQYVHADSNSIVIVVVVVVSGGLL